MCTHTAVLNLVNTDLNRIQTELLFSTENGLCYLRDHEQSGSGFILVNLVTYVQIFRQ